MIQLSLIVTDNLAARDIAKFLILNQYAVNVLIDDKLTHFDLVNEELEKTIIYQVTGVTRHLLFEEIEEKLKTNFPNYVIDIYAIPIVAMNWDLSEKLAGEITKV